MSSESVKPANSFMKSLFFGEVRDELLFPFPDVDGEVKETVRMINDTVEKFASDHVKSSEWDEAGKMPKDVIGMLAELGMMGLAVPEEFGGMGLPQSGYARVMQELSGMDTSVALTLGAHQSIGFKALLLYGTDEQKKRFLPRLASGECIAAYCLTEPGSGSDAASIQTKATLSEDGKYYSITGNKLWITNGEIAKFLTVFAKTEVEIAGEKKEKVTCFIVDLPAEGVSVGPAEHKLGVRASWTNAVHFDDVKVPVENVIGGLGKGFKVAMGVLNHGRLGLAACCVGMAKKCLNDSIVHCNERVQFKKKLREFGMIQEKVGRMAVKLYVAESMVYMTTALIDRPEIDYSLESAIAKIFATEMVWDISDENVQIWGGAGYMKEYPHERMLRDARITRIFEGTNEVLRAFVALSGMQGPGQEFAQLADVIKYPLKGLGLVSNIAMRNIKARVMKPSVSDAHPQLKHLTTLFEQHSARFSTQVQTIILRHRKEIFLRQFAQKRVADIAIDLYGMICVISRVTQALERRGARECEFEISMAEAFAHEADRRIRKNFEQIDRNDDDQIKQVADQVFDHGSVPFSYFNE